MCQLHLICVNYILYVSITSYMCQLHLIQVKLQPQLNSVCRLPMVTLHDFFKATRVRFIEANRSFSFFRNFIQHIESDIRHRQETFLIIIVLIVIWFGDTVIVSHLPLTNYLHTLSCRGHSTTASSKCKHTTVSNSIVRHTHIPRVWKSVIIIIIISLTSIFFQDQFRAWTAASQQH